LKDRFIELFINYTKEVEENSFLYDLDAGNYLAKKNLFPMASYYSDYLGFKTNLAFVDVVIGGIMADSLLYLTGIPASYHYLPITSVLLLFYFFYIRMFKARQNMIYGLLY